MSCSAVLDWLSSPKNPPVRYLTARDLLSRNSPLAARATRGQTALRRLQRDILNWRPLRDLVELQRADGSFPVAANHPIAAATFGAVCLLSRCGLNIADEPLVKAVGFLSGPFIKAGALSYVRGGSGVLPCYVGMVCRALIDAGGIELPAVQLSLRWIVNHQRYDHKQTRAGGEQPWSFRTPANYGCWSSVSCYHGVAGTLRALAAIPPERRTRLQKNRIRAALEYLRIHRAYKKSAGDKPLFRHLTQFFIHGGYRFHLIDILEAIAEADPKLRSKKWVRQAVDAVEELSEDGRITLVKNYRTHLVDPLPFEKVGQPSRFLTYQWLNTKKKLGLPSSCHSPLARATM